MWMVNICIQNSPWKNVKLDISLFSCKCLMFSCIMWLYDLYKTYNSEQFKTMQTSKRRLLKNTIIQQFRLNTTSTSSYSSKYFAWYFPISTQMCTQSFITVTICRAITEKWKCTKYICVVYPCMHVCMCAKWPHATA